MEIIGAHDSKWSESLSEKEASELAAFGITTDENMKIEEKKDERFLVWYDNVNAIKIFDACHPTAWRYSGTISSVARTGLDYSDVDVIRCWLGIPPSEELLAQLKFCQIVAMNYWAEQART